ncbi:hypothetical protein BDV24DRAFT_160702 [Aspergillus arachidicola]|uniref:AMP-dependent synthetase/ligase domain-containing protein n=1 Tax=Aspergillus arachidicola TaxID=656916 RepID=A0A5N6YFA5_9EURO|nr:hypothetical protein BDV24DRAFT_160702 [Aspergillus arachidicola]
MAGPRAAWAGRGFPNDPVFNQLHRLSREIQGAVVYDPSGIEANYSRFAQDISRVCATLREKLPASSFDKQGVLLEESPYVPVLTLGGYEYIVCFYATLALGGACVPLAPDILPEEAEYIMQRTGTTSLVAGHNRLTEATGIRDDIAERTGKDIFVIPLPCSEESLSGVTIAIDHDLVLPPSRPAAAIHTSGTSGYPKLVVLPRQRFYWNYTCDAEGAVLAYRPPHWVGGMRSLIHPLLQGQKLYILPNHASMGDFWKQFRDISLHTLAITPTVLRQLKDYFQRYISPLPEEERAEYIRGIRRVQEACCSSAMIEDSTLEYWRELLGDVPIINVYAITEAGLVTRTRKTSNIKHSVGIPYPGVSIKLSDGDYGEALVKSPMMFTRYLGDDDATQCAFNEEGYYRTGDILRRVGEEYVFEGRASTDFLFFYSHRISIPELESSLKDLHYIAEAYVIGAPDHEARELVAAIVRLHHGHLKSAAKITLARIRNDLAATLPCHKLPSLLRILHDSESIPHTASGKPVKKGLLQKFFNITNFVPANYVARDVEYWGTRYYQILSQSQPWDWCGLQADGEMIDCQPKGP